MRRVKKQNWLIRIYSENKLYAWFVIGIISFSGISIGIAMGNSNKSCKVKLEQSSDEIAYVDTQNVNTIPSKQESINQTEEINSNKKTNNNELQKDKGELETKNAKYYNKEKKLEFIMPLDGDVIKDFSQDTLMYSNTLEQWINHTGIDILSNESTPVKAIEDGIVTEIKEDPRYGYTVIIDHGQGYKSIYCNLSTLDMVSLNKNVEKGQVISGVGNTALFEMKDKKHLHLEIMKNGVSVNPIDYIKKGE